MKVYKYRSNEETFLERDLSTFSKNRFFASTFENLNDLFEANFNESISKSLKILETIFKVDSQDVSKSFNEILTFKDRLGIMSLSKTVLSDQMWAYYSNSNKGYCIEYDFDRISERNQNYDLSFSFDVSYKNILPVLTIEDIRNGEEAAKKMFGVKKEHWHHEQEIRLIFDSSSLKEHHESAITGVYFGYLADDDLISAFREKFEHRDVTFYKMTPNRRINILEFAEHARFSRKLKHDLSKFNFELVKTKNNSAVVSYYLFVRGEYAKDGLLELARSFVEEHGYKPSNIYLLNSKSSQVLDLIGKYPKTDKEYLLWAETVIADFPFDSDDISLEPFKDYRYNKLKYDNGMK